MCAKKQRETVVYTTCKSEEFQKEIEGYKLRTQYAGVFQDRYRSIDYNINIPKDIDDEWDNTTTKVKDIPCTCKLDRATLRQILPTPDNSNPVTCYQSCPRVLHTAMMRQLRAPQPISEYFQYDKDDKNRIQNFFNTQYIREFHNFCDEYFEEYLLPLLQNFTYDIGAWMNHVKTLNKQKEVLQFYTDYVNKGKKYDIEWETNKYLDYTLFCKAEKQTVSDKYGKCRAISACSPLTKWVLGPITVALEKLFQNNLDGFKISLEKKPCKTWEEMESAYEYYYKHGFDTTIDIDGSAWDSTQSYHMKYLMFKVYTWLADNDKITHVDSEFFKKLATKRVKTLVAKAYVNGRTVVIARAHIDSTTFSGDPGTLVDNTMSNLIVNKWILSKFGLKNHQYKMFCSGDDFSLLIACTNNTKQLHDFIEKHWKGLGLLPKYIKKGNYQDITFCSTNVIKYNENNEVKFKIIRQLDRIIPLTHYSRKALNYSKNRLKGYYDELATGMLKWVNGMPLFRDYIDALQYYRDQIPGPIEKDKDGKPKMQFPTSGEIYDSDTTYHIKEKIRTSARKPPDEVVYQYFIEKYRITPTDISCMRDKLYNRSSYSELEPDVLPIAQYIPRQDHL